MKYKKILAIGLISVLAVLAFIDNIPSGAEQSWFPEEEWIKATHTYGHLETGQIKERKNALIDGDDFSDFMREFNGENLHYEHGFDLDTTGDGEMETLRQEVSVLNSECHIAFSIEKNGRKIWDSRTVIGMREAESLIGGSVFIRKNGDLSLFYLGICNLPVLGKLRFDQAMNTGSSAFLNKVLSNVTQESEKDLLRNELMSYRGFFISDALDPSGRIFKWNEEAKSFTCIYSHNILLS